ncbi:unnamed protein product [Darwinula stevensoni]|uniref:Transmembrane protein n=1 Tax=Darwinula stevensoni TaxID=69355 RepID=A0A7R8X9F3_9CRUS|nr:unnamed protein product [Darwinula stevensoni]CAG0891061.1 unnamed protein product [Darwinula stevensoni]
MASTCVLVTTTIFYWTAFLVGFLIFIPLFLVQNEYDVVLNPTDGQENPGCMLFVTVIRYEEKKQVGSNRNICHTAIFLPLAAIGISALLGSYFTYKSCKVVTSLNKDISYGTSIWPFLLLNTVVTIVVGVCAAFTSAGFVETCSQIRRQIMEKDLSPYAQEQESCFEHVRFTTNRNLDLTALIYVSVFMYWCEFLIWLVLVMLQVVRLRLRVRWRHRSHEKELSQFTPLEETVMKESFL